MVSKRPCTICRCWFQPDARVGKRQRACSKAECRAALRKQTQAQWRASNPDYAIAWQMQKRAAEAEEAPAALRVPAPLGRLPWDLAKDEFGDQGADFLGHLGRVLVMAMKDERRAQGPDTS